MPTRFSRRRMLAGMAALPALTLCSCESDRTAADPISTVDTLDFANRLRIPALAASSAGEDGVRLFRPERRCRSGRIPHRHVNAYLGYTDGSYKAGYLGPTLR